MSAECEELVLAEEGLACTFLELSFSLTLFKLHGTTEPGPTFFYPGDACFLEALPFLSGIGPTE